MKSLIDLPTIDLTLLTSDAQIEMVTADPDDTFSMTKIKIGRQDVEQYFKNFKEYSTEEHKGKTSATCILCKETVWHLKDSTANCSRHIQRKHKTEFELWSKNIGKEKNQQK